MNPTPAHSYRPDIDGLRAIAVMAVIVFHLGYLPSGYLGVDVFFVISGYLITSIVHKEVQEDRFSIVQFYLRRIRRIIPLILFTTSIALLIGLMVMLPDDLENLSQSVVATNLFANNILQLLTTRNYWDVINEYKLLMHTWSLGIEEQFYIFYPVMFLLLQGKRAKWIVPTLVVLTLISLGLYITASDEAVRFYCIQYRFYELAMGGLGAILFRNVKLSGYARLVPFIALLLLLFVDLPIPDSLKLFLAAITSLATIVCREDFSKLSTFVLENKLMVGIGKISFSLYMWHQIVLAFSRYSLTPHFTATETLWYLVIIFGLSVLSYSFIEQPFRNKTKISTRSVLVATSLLFVVSCSASLFVYSRAGVIKNIPELEITKNNIHRNMHAEYNERIYAMDKGFTDSGKIRVFIVGNSFARDWANILLESNYKDLFDISYTMDVRQCKDAATRIAQAEYVFLTEITKKECDDIIHDFDIAPAKVRYVGTKNFGVNNGLFYSKRGKDDYLSQRTELIPGIMEKELLARKQWTTRFIDLLALVVDKKGTVPVFSPDGKFISQDCRHLTHGGAIYFAQLLDRSGYFRVVTREKEKQSVDANAATVAIGR